MIISWRNRISDYTLSATSEATPIDNVKDIRLDKNWQAESTATQTIIIDCLAAVSPGVIALLGHNLTGATVKLQGNTSSDFTTPAFSYTFTVAEIDDIIFYIADNMTAYQYWAIVIESATSIPYIGHIHFDTGDFLPDQLAMSITPIDFNDKSLYTISDSGSLFGYKNNTIVKSFQIIFEDVPATEYISVVEFFEYVGKVLPFIIFWNDEDIIPGIKNIFCHLKENLKISKIMGQNRFDYSLSVEEVK